VCPEVPVRLASPAERPFPRNERGSTGL